MPPVLEAEGISKKFQLNKKVIQVFNNLDFSLEEGDFLTILGPSGCGKSTLIRCICSFENIDEGLIKVDGAPISKPGPNRIMVFQDYDQLFHWKTVFDNVIYPINYQNKHTSKRERTRIAEDFLKMVNLSEFSDAYPSQLSGGMRQRVAIARALALQPKILLMDEPFGALDAQTRSILQKELIGIWEKTNITIIFITHNIQESIILGNKIMVLSQLPAYIKLLIDNPLPLPRIPETIEFMELWKKLYNNLDIKRF